MTVVPTVATILDFNMAAITNRAQNDVFYHNFGSTTDTNIIQVAIPRLLGPVNQMVPSAMMSHGRHIGFKDGHRCKCISLYIARLYAQKNATAMKS
jgi:hypothetical protein